MFQIKTLNGRLQGSKNPVPWIPIPGGINFRFPPVQKRERTTGITHLITEVVGGTAKRIDRGEIITHISGDETGQY